MEYRVGPGRTISEIVILGSSRFAALPSSASRAKLQRWATLIPGRPFWTVIRKLPAIRADFEKLIRPLAMHLADVEEILFAALRQEGAVQIALHRLDRTRTEYMRPLIEQLLHVCPGGVIELALSAWFLSEDDDPGLPAVIRAVIDLAGRPSPHRLALVRRHRTPPRQAG